MAGMRMARMKVPAHAPSGFYHCMSRVVDRRFILQEAEKEEFVRLMREYEAFCGVRVLTFVVMSNHFHVLVEVPQPPPVEARPDMDPVLEMLGGLTGHQNVGAVRQQVELFRQNQDAKAEAQLLGKYHARMWDVSPFMKLLKQRLSQWYNRRHQRKGTLWEERFKSVVVEGAGQALAAMAAYIDLNPVRAGLVEDPKEYRWSGYAQAVAGVKGAREGLRRVMEGKRGKSLGLKEALEGYRMELFQKGGEAKEGMEAQGKRARGSLSGRAVRETLAAKGKLGLGDYVRCRVRYFCDGAVLGSREFEEGMFRAHRGRFGDRRRTGARWLEGLGEEMYALRDLGPGVFG